MARSAQEFAIEIDREWAETMGGLRQAVIYIATEGLSKVQTKSPVDTGQFKSNWLASVGKLDPSVNLFPDDAEGFQGPRGNLAGKSSAAIASYAATEGFPVIYLQNNLPYARRLENGWSDQASGGMVALTVAELQALWNRIRL